MLYSFYHPIIKSATDYYAFGSPIEDRMYQADGYRYGFNGKQDDDEVNGVGNFQDYGFRYYDSRIGRFMSVDPLAISFPWNSPYAFAENDVIRNIDLDGKEKLLSIVPDNNTGNSTIQGSVYEEDIRENTEALAKAVRSFGSDMVKEALRSPNSSNINFTQYYDHETGQYHAGNISQTIEVEEFKSIQHRIGIGTMNYFGVKSNEGPTKAAKIGLKITMNALDILSFGEGAFVFKGATSLFQQGKAFYGLINDANSIINDYTGLDIIKSVLGESAASANNVANSLIGIRDAFKDRKPGFGYAGDVRELAKEVNKGYENIKNKFSEKKKNINEKPK
jgi:RHS repeat-associated protein